jgi:hypothetical protein
LEFNGLKVSENVCSGNPTDLVQKLKPEYWALSYEVFFILHLHPCGIRCHFGFCGHFAEFHNLWLIFLGATPDYQ